MRLADLKRPAEIVLFVAGVCLVGLGRPWGLLAVPCLFGWYWLWHARPLPAPPPRERDLPPDRS